MGHVGEELSALLDDELAPARSLAVTRHLDACAACCDELEGLRRTRAALRGLGDPEPSVAWMLETFVLPSEQDGPAGPARRRRTRLATTGLLGTLAVATAVAFLAGGGGDRGRVVPPVQQLVVDHLGRTTGGPVLTPVGLDTATTP